MDQVPDYSKLIDAETWAFIERTNSWYPPDTYSKSIVEQRAIYDAMCREFFAGYPQGVTATDGTIDNDGYPVPVRRYRRAGSDAEAQVVYTHGGSFYLGGLESHDDVCAEICDLTGFAVTAVDYRRPPEFPFPVYLNDALAAFRHEAAAGSLPIIVVGDSAGGNIAAAISHVTRGEELRPAGQVLIYPFLGGDHHSGSYLYHADAPLLSRHEILVAAETRKGRGLDADDPRAAPLADTDFSILPPTVAISAECDPICDDGRRYRDRILAAGGKAVWFNEKGLVHGYLRARQSAKRARASFNRIAEAIRALGLGLWPYPSDQD